MPVKAVAGGSRGGIWCPDGKGPFEGESGPREAQRLTGRGGGIQNLVETFKGEVVHEVLRTWPEAELRLGATSWPCSTASGCA